MSKSLEQTKSALKLRTSAREGALTLRLGVRKYVLPFEVRMIASDEYVFVHIPPSAELFRLDGAQLQTVTDANEAEKASGTFRKTRKRSASKGVKTVDIPADIVSALSKLPSGYKIGYEADGTPKLIKTRKRSR